jgi:hypothetical protein
VLFQILRTLKALLALFASVWLERNVNSDMASDVISFGGLGGASSPGAGQTQIICRLAADVLFAQVLLQAK